MADLGFTLTAPFKQYKVTPRAITITVETHEGQAYLKASRKREGAISQSTHGFALYLVRKPLYVNAEEEWILMEDYGPTVNEKFIVKDLKCMQIPYGRMKLESMHHTDELVTADFSRQEAGAILHRVNKMLGNNVVLEGFAKFDGFAPVDNDGKANLTKYCQAVSDFLNYIYDRRVPFCQVHKDLGDCIVIKPNADENGYVVFD